MSIPCPKCTDYNGKPNRMVLVDEVAMPSSLSRTEGTGGSIISGYKCWSCGTRKEVEIEKTIPVLNFSKREPKEFCIRGHARTPDNLDSKGACKICQRAVDLRRGQTEAYKEYQRAYRGKTTNKKARGITFGVKA